MCSKSTGAGKLTTDVEGSELTRASGSATEVVVELAVGSELMGVRTVAVAVESTVGSELTGASRLATEVKAERVAGSELTGASRSVTHVEVESIVASVAWVSSRGPTMDVMSLGDIGPVKFCVISWSE